MRKPRLWHPLLFALFPAVFLFQVNPAMFTAEVLAAPAAASLALVGVLWAVSHRLMGNRNKAALLVSAAILLGFSYGVLYLVMGELRLALGGLAIGPQGLALVIAGGLLGLFALWCARTPRELHYFTGVTNISAGVLVLMSIGGAAHYTVKNRVALGNRKRPPPPVAARASAGAATPDVYYIVLDAYGRSDVLREIYQYDNSDFTGYLRDRGFYVAGSSRSAYLQTILSLASSLNLDYVQELVGEYDGRVSDRRPSGIFATEARSADLYLSRPWFLNDFDSALLNMTPLPALLTQLGLPELYELHRRRITYTLDALEAMPRQPGPRFVFVHILAPHPPFVFREDGTPVNLTRPFDLADGRDFTAQAGATRPQYLEGYRGQAVYLTRRIRHVIEAILAQSATPPIILLQSDHGPGSLLDLGTSLNQNPCLKERFGILNACFLPNRDYSGFSESITPINTARLV